MALCDEDLELKGETQLHWDWYSLYSQIMYSGRVEGFSLCKGKIYNLINLKNELRALLRNNMCSFNGHKVMRLSPTTIS
jgi:hypothetical protein